VTPGTPRVHTVLIADDVAALRNLLRLGLEAGGHFKVIGEAATGIEATARAAALQPDLVLLDLSMPEMDGLQALPRVLEAAPNARVAVLSGFNHIRMAPVAQRLGASGYFEKGIEPGELVQRLLAIVEPAPPPGGGRVGGTSGGAGGGAGGNGAGGMGGGMGGEMAPAADAGLAAPSPATSTASSSAPAPNGTRPAQGLLPSTPATPAAPGSGTAQANGAVGVGAAASAMLPAPTAGASGPALRVLLVQGSEEPAKRALALLQAAQDATFTAVRVASLQEARQALVQPTDLLLVDPTGLEVPTEDALVELLSRAATLPLVALLPHKDPALARQALRLGVEDCLVLENADAALMARSLLYATERRRAHAVRGRLREQEEEVRRLRELEHMKTEFFNAAAHELGTPLTPLRIQIGLLKARRKESMDEVERKSIQILDRNVERLAALNRQLLDVARIQAGHLRIEPHPTDLHALVQDVTDSLEPVALEKGVRFETACPGNEWVDADAQRLGQVLFNLVSNAIKFTPRDGCIRVEVDPAPGQCTIRVVDTGAGLRADQIARLFQPFTQVLGDLQPAGVGTGLGLFVCRGIIELHGGRIWCESAGPGKGTTFFFTLPRKETAVAAMTAGA